MPGFIGHTAAVRLPANCVRRGLRVGIPLAVAVVTLAPWAQAHGPETPGTGYLSKVNAITPNVLGVSANVIGGDAKLRLSNYSGKTVVIRGYGGEPYLRFDARGVYENTRSPAVYLNRVRYPTGSVPAIADPEAPPQWHRLSGGNSFTWSDHRIHWPRDEVPPVVQKDPQKTQRILSWRVPGVADGTPFAITGILGYRPLPVEPTRVPGWVPVTLAVITVLALFGLWATHRRTRRWVAQP